MPTDSGMGQPARESTQPGVISAAPESPLPRTRAARSPAARRSCFRARSSTRRILPEIVFGSSANSSRRTRLNGARCSRRWRKIAQRGVAVRRAWPPRQRDERLRHRQPQRVGRRHDRRFGHRRVLDQRAFQLERADPVVGGFEHVVGAADIGEIAVGVAHRHIAGAVGGAARPARPRRRRPDSPASGRAAAGRARGRSPPRRARLPSGSSSRTR